MRRKNVLRKEQINLDDPVDLSELWFDEPAPEYPEIMDYEFVYLTEFEDEQSE